MARLLVFGEPADPRLWVKCANAISERIADGRYPPGQWLPPLAKICADLGTTHPPVKRALEEASRQRLITLAPGSGYYAGDGQPPPAPPEHAPATATAPRKQPRPRRKNRKPPPSAALPPAVQLITVSELAAFLRLSTMTIYRAVENGELPGAKRVGRSIRIPLSSVPEYVKSIGIPPSLHSISDLASPSGQPEPPPEEEQP